MKLYQTIKTTPTICTISNATETYALTAEKDEDEGDDYRVTVVSLIYVQT